MCCDHQFSQRNKATEKAVGVGDRGNREMEGVWLQGFRGFYIKRSSSTLLFVSCMTKSKSETLIL